MTEDCFQSLAKFVILEQYHLSSALRFIIESHTIEVIRSMTSKGDRGVHVSQISKVNGVNASKLSHILRMLATHYIFDEVQPDTFANNRLSSTLDTGKSLRDILADPMSKYDGPSGGFAALIAITYVCRVQAQVNAERP